MELFTVLNSVDNAAFVTSWKGRCDHTASKLVPGKFVQIEDDSDVNVSRPLTQVAVFHQRWCGPDHGGSQRRRCWLRTLFLTDSVVQATRPWSVTLWSLTIKGTVTGLDACLRDRTLHMSNALAVKVAAPQDWEVDG